MCDIDRGMTCTRKGAPFHDEHPLPWTPSRASDRWVEYLAGCRDDFPGFEHMMFEALICFASDSQHFKDMKTRQNDPNLIRANPNQGRRDLYYRFADQFNTSTQRLVLMVLLRVDSRDVDPAYLPDSREVEPVVANQLLEYA